MIVISIMNLKGGSSKSTVSMNLARGIQLDNARVCIIDMDEQLTISTWHQISKTKHVDVYQSNAKGLSELLKTLANNYDICVIDTPPQVKELALSVIQVSSIVLIPVNPSPSDYWASINFAQLVKQRMAVSKLKAVYLLTKVKPNSIVANQIRSALETTGLSVLNTAIGDRTVYAKAIGDGVTVLECGEYKAIREIQKLTKEIRELL
jgi:chromosome partitioning protein